MDKKGNLTDSLGQYTGVALVIMIIAASVIALAAFQSSQVTDTAGCNSTVVTGCNEAHGILGNGLTFFTNLTDQFSTIGTVAGIMLLVVVVISGSMFAYGRTKR
jgi:hypothetical protein